MAILIKLFLQTLAVIVAAYILPGVYVESFLTAVVIAIVLGIINVFIKPVLVILTLPVTILTLGLFLLILNGLLIIGITYIVPGFQVDGIIWAILFSIVVSLVSSLLSSFE